MKLTKKQMLEAERKRNDKLLKMIGEAREQVAGYEQLAKVHAAYIAFLIQKLGATKDSPVTITKEDVVEAMKLEVRGLPDGEGFKLYIEE